MQYTNIKIEFHMIVLCHLSDIVGAIAWFIYPYWQEISRVFWQGFYTPLLLLCLNSCICMEAYCVKCKSKRDMKDEKKVTMKNGKPATQGICTVCGTKMFKIGK